MSIKFTLVEDVEDASSRAPFDPEGTNEETEVMLWEFAPTARYWVCVGKIDGFTAPTLSVNLHEATGNGYRTSPITLDINDLNHVYPNAPSSNLHNLSAGDVGKCVVVAINEAKLAAHVNLTANPPLIVAKKYPYGEDRMLALIAELMATLNEQAMRGMFEKHNWLEAFLTPPQ
jgi:hypothetical protein